MPYTLSMALLWVTLAVTLGVVIGWLMRSVVAKRQIERARSNHLDSVELERLRGRVAELEPAVADRDRLRAELEATRTELEACRDARVLVDPTNDASTVGATARPSPNGSPAVAGSTDEAADPPGGATTDLADAAAVLGAPIERDDLTVVEGIGPKVALLCEGIGITTWHDLAQTEVSLLRTMLHDAGPRFRSHDPSTWPEQAGLLAAGRWSDFRALTEQLTRGSTR